MIVRTRALVMAVRLVAMSGAAAAWAQAPQAKITGFARDGSGAVLPGTAINATNQATKESENAVTGADGSYALSVAPGAYSVVARLSGFRRVAQVVEVGPGGAKQADFVLEATLSEEITVTAMKRDETILNVPFSVAAPTEEMLRSRGVDDIEGVAANVGGFTVQNLGPGQSQVAMRGVSAGQIVRDQPGVKEQVGVYLDESVISLSLFTPDLDLFDTNRVEVLRGPQGTLFGSGSLSGTVRYITNQPEIGLRKGFAEFEASTVNGGNMGGDVKVDSTSRLATRRRCASRHTSIALPDTWTRYTRISASRRTSTTACAAACADRSGSSRAIA
jgi:outer membrane receptor protein involved in Fe transport